MKTVLLPARGLFGGLLIACSACSSNAATPSQNGGAAGALGAATGGTTGATGGVGGGATSAAGTAASAGHSAGGTGGVSGSTGLTAGGSAGFTGGAGGSTELSGGAGGSAGLSAGGSGGSAGTSTGGGGAVSASCADHNYQLCIDFESGIDTAIWTGGTDNAIVTTDFAHGAHSYSLYANGAGTGGRLMSTQVGTITNQVWGRFYIHFKPGAPGGHGNIVAAYDQSGNWYEMGYQFDGMMGVWHGGGGEHPRRSKPYIVDQWYCIETYFDGAAAAMPKWYVDGVEAEYYNPVKADGTMVTEPNGPTPTVATQFTRLEAGFTPYAGLGIKQPDTVGDQSETRVLTDLWIDDIAFDTQRIGCITP